jgi:zinc transport system substrate-binding protein
VFWVGPRLEHFLQPALKVLSSRVVVVALDDLVADPHIWMDPIAMQSVAQRIADVYAGLRPAQAQLFYANAARVQSELAAEDRRLREQLVANQPHRGFIVEHDAYARFESRYGLKHLAALTDNSDLPPSVQGMMQIRNLLDKGEVGCVLGETQESTQLRALLDGRAARVVRLDAMAASVSVSSDGLLGFYRQLSESISGCLKR